MGRRLAGMTMVLLAVGCSSKAAPNARQASRTASSFEAPSSSSTTSTEANHVASDANALARRIGCGHIDNLTDVAVGNLPKPTASVGCTIGGVDISISVYGSHDDVQRYTSESGRAAVCAMAGAFGIHTIYSVVGNDFTAAAQTHGADDSTLAQAQALGKALGLPATTTRC